MAGKGHVTRTVEECQGLVSADSVDELQLERATQILQKKWGSYLDLFAPYETQE